MRFVWGCVCNFDRAYIGAVTRIYRRILTLFVRSKTTKSMNTSGEESEEKLQSEIKKEVEKLKYYVDNADEIIEEGDCNEIKIINSRTAVILDKINTLVANVQELKIGRGETARNVRQWKNEIKSSTVDALKKNMYVNNLMHGGEDVEDLVKFKEKSSTILESGKFRVHKWESNVAALESERMPNPTKCGEGPASLQIANIEERYFNSSARELVSGHMAANLARNLCSALLGWPIMSITIWIDSLVALFWINKSGKPWKVFASNKVKKIAEITEELKIVWKYCPTKTNLLSRSSYWRTLRMTAWMLRFVSNYRIKRKTNRKIGPLNTDEILNARTR